MRWLHLKFEILDLRGNKLPGAEARFRARWFFAGLKSSSPRSSGGLPPKGKGKDAGERPALRKAKATATATATAMAMGNGKISTLVNGARMGHPQKQHQRQRRRQLQRRGRDPPEGNAAGRRKRYERQ